MLDFRYIFKYKISLLNVFLGSALSDNANYDEACHGSPNPKKWDPPLIFDLNVDPGERYGLSANTELYR